MANKRYTSRNRWATIGKETTFNGGATQTAYFRANDVKPSFKYNYLESKELTGSRIGAQPTLDTGSGTLDLSFNLDADNYGWAAKAALGLEAVSSLGSGQYKHVFTFGNGSSLPSFDLYTSIGGYKIYSNRGAVCNSFALDLKSKDYVTGNLNFITASQTDLSQTFASADVNATTDLITLTNTFVADDQVKLYPVDAGVLPAPLTADTVYFVKTPTGTTLKLAAGAGGAAIDLTDAGTGSFEIVKQNALTANSLKALTFSDVKTTGLQIGGVDFNEGISFSRTINNNLDAEDYRINSGATLVGIDAGAFKIDGKLEVNLNEGSYYLHRDKYKTGATIPTMQLTIDSGVTLGTGTYKVIEKYANVLITACEFSGSNYETLSLDWSAYGSSAVSLELYNAKAVAY